MVVSLGPENKMDWIWRKSVARADPWGFLLSWLFSVFPFLCFLTTSRIAAPCTPAAVPLSCLCRYFVTGLPGLVQARQEDLGMNGGEIDFPFG